MKFIDKIYNKLDEYFSSDDKKAYKELSDKYNELQTLNSNCTENFNILNESYVKLNNNYSELKQQYDELNINKIQEDELESYWNNKRPQTTWTWKARPLFEKKDGSWIQNNIEVDPRIFFTYDPRLVVFDGTNDQKAQKCLHWVATRIAYTSDGGEFWQFPFETHARRKGDCEDGAILMANMMLMSGIPYWRIRLNAGDVKGGGHAYLTYLREEDNQWYVMDWCYWYNECKNFSLKWKDADKYYGIWCSWNQKYCYGDIPKNMR